MRKPLQSRSSKFLRTMFFVLPVLTLLLSASLVSAQDADPGAVNNIYLPVISSGDSGVSELSDEPLRPESYDSSSETQPQAATLNNPSTNTNCSNYIKFTNQSSFTVKVYWVNGSGQEVLYKTLNAGAAYWQQTYYGHLWRVRGPTGALVREVRVNTCATIYINITNSNFPPTPTPTPACATRIQTVKLWNMDTQLPVAGYDPIPNGATIYLQDLPANFNIRSHTSGATGSLKFDVNGHVVIENTTPYGYPTDSVAWRPTAGSYTVKVTAYTGSNATGTVCDTWTTSFTFANRPTPTNTPAICNAAITSFKLFDIAAGKPVAVANPIVDGGTIFVQDLPASFNIEAMTSGTVGSVKFVVNGTTDIENTTPYRYPGDAEQWVAGVGAYSVQAMIFSASNATGTMCSSRSINFTLANRVPTATPTNTSVPPTPTNTPAAPTATPTNTSVPPTPTNTPATPTATPTNTSLPPTPTPTNTPGTATACLGNRVFLDINGNGIQNTTEPRVSGVTVNLWIDDNGDGTADRQIASTETISDGFYQFCGLTPGVRYVVQFIAPPGYALTLSDVGANDELDSDPNPTTGFTRVYVLAAGQVDNSVDAGLVETIEPPTNTPTPVPPTPTNTPSPNNGIIGDHVFNDANRNGIKDNGEIGVDDVQVDLLDCNNNLIASKSTVGGGMYKFDNLAAGCYRVRVNLPSGYSFSPQNQGGDEAADSDVSPVNGTTDDVNLATGENNPNVDAGIYFSLPPTPTPTPSGGSSSIGNYVWNDLNKDGIQDGNEPGVANVIVRLLTCNDDFITSTTTSFDGRYLFDNLAAGCYKSQFVLPAGYVFTLQNVGSDNLDSDADPATGITQGETVAVGSGDNSLDGGIYADANTGTILGTSWFDQDNDGIKDGNEGPFTNVTVNLLAGCTGNTILRTIQTDANGDYSFGALVPGAYRIQAIEVPGFPFSPKDAAGDDSIDSDIDRVTGISDCINVIGGSTTDIDIGVDPL